ncbi:MAG: ClpX C4-type zinc finger protein, partial [Thermogemmatispora sp.]|uniref:ClpX C4-type zinc finger protein n=1 Tax=Thermogemmatispora sp. TaxID=1968838 RepID=UPI001D7F98A2
MSFDRTLARCSFCGRRPPEVRRMIAGPGAAYICEACLQTCNEILQDPRPFSPQALELASRPPVVVAAPLEPPTRSEGAQ